ncbi:cation diffusion facilitator family transporter [Paenibacillus sp. PK4536]|uniref:Putative transporter YeaB n=1 Tax=Paenibacillus nuruki TaxID=1886670 RepID=A0A1E3LBT5_9BACL|nr:MULTISPECIES: cation diffusion facilitator family transporter [Paenibacillus]ODP30400.1 putative transporter YeaB [Paenibacillus nuruki]TKJ87055.1 cation transporter [Paenibacillus sp. CFBP13512]WIM39580.1 cation diffusion facilitator family transporter [Paenibacillus sp. PK4536]CAJ1313570.1 Cation transporter [Paenibacillus nuruki]
MVDVYQNIKAGERGAWVSIISYLILSSFKLTIGYLFLSSALKADGLNNLTDIVASLAVLIGLKISRKPPDSDHAYGHFRAETVAALIASFIMAMVGVQVLVDGVQSLFAGREESPALWTAGVAVLCAVVMYFVYRYNIKLSRQTGSQALKAAAKDNLSDALVSIGAAVGIIGSQFGMPWLDIVAALAVGLIICKTAWEILSESMHRLTDGFDEKELPGLRQTIESIDGVEHIKDIKARVNGSQTLLDVVIEVQPDLTIIESHDITDEIEAKMEQVHNIRYVHVHVEPKNIK